MFASSFFKLRFVALALLTLVGAPQTRAQELRVQKHPLSTYLDLRPMSSGAAPQTAPSWVESFSFIPATGFTPTSKIDGHAAEAEDRSVFRIRLLHPSTASDYLQMRVFFEDKATGPRLKITVWNELGEKMMSKPLGEGLGLPSSEVQTVFMNGVNYLEIDAPGDGSQVRGIFLSWMESAQVLQPSDFPSREAARQPFGLLPPKRAPRDDTYLLGTVTAQLQGRESFVMRPGDSPARGFEFDLEHQPLMAVLTYEVLGAAIDAPPTVAVNGRSLGASEFHLPDLADPAFRGETREAEARMNFRYTGWLRAQKVVPAELLTAGLNNLSVKLSNTADSVAIRSVSLQLKYNWDKLDTVLVPAATPPSNENR